MPKVCTYSWSTTKKLVVTDRPSYSKPILLEDLLPSIPNPKLLSAPLIAIISGFPLNSSRSNSTTVLLLRLPFKGKETTCSLS